MRVLKVGAADMNVLVIGGSGLFGRKIAIHLLRDTEVNTLISLDLNPPPDWFYRAIRKSAGKFHFRRGDVSDLEAILNLIKTFSIDRIINMAAILTGAFEQQPRAAVKTNVLGVCNVFEAARLTGISRVVYASSVAVYGTASEYGNREVNEDDHLHPLNAYGLTKQLSEILAERYHDLYGINSSGIRPFLGYGHGGAFPPIIKLFSDLVSLPAVGKTFSVEADGSSPAALSSAEDVAALTRILIKAPSSPHPVYNIANPPTSMRELAAVVRRYLPEAKIEFGNQAPPAEAARSGLPWRVSMARAREDLGFTVMPLEEAVLAHINDARLEAELEEIRR
jgi:nucleoside-diphosphate-sugar epimerase